MAKSKSIMQKDMSCCYFCHRFGTEKHHIVFGTSNRKQSDKAGLIVGLCYEHHRGTNGVHGKNGQKLNKWLKEEAQLVFEDKVGTRAEFVKRFGKNYL